MISEYFLLQALKILVPSWRVNARLRLTPARLQEKRSGRTLWTLMPLSNACLCSNPPVNCAALELNGLGSIQGMVDLRANTCLNILMLGGSKGVSFKFWEMAGLEKLLKTWTPYQEQRRNSLTGKK